MVKLSFHVCDVCQDASKKATSYRIATDHRSARVDLCDGHAEPLIKLLDEFARPPAVRPKFEEAVMTIEEIERLKQKRKR